MEIESPFRKRFSKAFLWRSVDERSGFAPQATSEVCTLAMHRIVISSIKRYWLKRPIPFYCCLENNTVAKSKLINIILVQSILHILQLRCGHTDYRFPLSLSCDYIIHCAQYNFNRHNKQICPVYFVNNYTGHSICSML